jgi:PAT family beta-lactamase induction signal transducer AmpG
MISAWKNIYETYRDPRLIIICALGVASGFPLALTGSTFSAWLTESELSLQSIGLMSLVGIFYVIKWLWAPFIDNISLPFAKKFGRRRSWMILCQSAIALGLCLMAGLSPQNSLLELTLAALFVAFFSASLDITIDAYRVELLQHDQQSAASAAAVLGYRIGMLLSGAGGLWLATAFGWHGAYIGMGIATLIASFAMFFLPEPELPIMPEGEAEKGKFQRVIISPFKDLLARPQIFTILAFIILFKSGDAFIGTMSIPFFLKIGFSKATIASVVKLFGFFATLLGAAAAGVLIRRYGMWNMLLFSIIAQTLSNAVFVLQAIRGADLATLIFTISIENIAGGFGTAVLIAYFATLCTRSYTASQFALLSGLAPIFRLVFGATSGIVAATLGWTWFFILSMGFGIPAFLLLLRLKKKEQPQ